MARTDTLPHFLTDVADAIRAKTGESGTIQASTFDTAIGNISTANLQEKSITITEEGTTTIEPDEGYDGISSLEITVNIGGGGGHNLPAEYQEVTYIESTGTQYINTGYKHKSNTKIIMDCNVKNEAPNPFSAIFGARKGNYNYNNMSFFVRFHANYSPAYCRSGAETGGSDMLYNNDIRVTAEGQTATWSLLDGTGQVYSITTTGTADNGYNPMFIFNINTATNSGATADTSYSKVKLYSFIASENNVEIRHLIPCYRKADNVIGLYDLVTEEFYTNGGSGTFLKGTNVS